MSEPIQHFLIIFDHAAGRLVDVEEFGSNSAKAVAAYSAKEKELQGRDMIEIVLIGSDSLDTVKLTHANYFDESVALSKSKYLVGV
jgi:hypothetical protein